MVKIQKKEKWDLTIFPEDEETLIVKWIKDMAKSGFPITKDNFLTSVG